MKERNPILVFVFGLITIGIYSWYWAVKTKGEMNQLGEKIPTAWLWLIPIVGTIIWYWKYSQGVEHISNGKTSGVLAFILLWLLGGIGQAIIQDGFNNLPKTAVPNPGAVPPTANPPIVTGGQPPTAPAAQPPVATVNPVAAQPLTTPTQPAEPQTPESNIPTQTPPASTPTIGSI